VPQEHTFPSFAPFCLLHFCLCLLVFTASCLSGSRVTSVLVAAVRVQRAQPRRQPHHLRPRQHRSPDRSGPSLPRRCAGDLSRLGSPQHAKRAHVESTLQAPDPQCHNCKQGVPRLRDCLGFRVKGFPPWAVGPCSSPCIQAL
jgi:hypothetical protein